MAREIHHPSTDAHRSGDRPPGARRSGTPDDRAAAGRAAASCPAPSCRAARHARVDLLVPPEAAARGRHHARRAQRHGCATMSLRSDDLDARFPGLLDALEADAPAAAAIPAQPSSSDDDQARWHHAARCAASSSCSYWSSVPRSRWASCSRGAATAARARRQLPRPRRISPARPPWTSTLTGRRGSTPPPRPRPTIRYSPHAR